MNYREIRLQKLAFLGDRLQQNLLEQRPFSLGPNDALLISEFIRDHIKNVIHRRVRRKQRIRAGGHW